MTEREFTHDWFTGNALPAFKALTNMVPKNGAFLEIGAFEGRATCWMLDNWMGPDAALMVIEPFTGAADHAEMKIDWGKVRERFMKNTGYEDDARMHLFECPSTYALPQIVADIDNDGSNQFDFIYVDGSHRARDVLFDAAMGWEALKVGGIMLFDDYLWGDRTRPLETPRPAIDAFCLLHGDELEVVVMGYQYGIRKIK